jgi:hypothetical protein
MKTLKFIPFLSLLLFVLLTNVVNAQTKSLEVAKTGLEIIQFHSEHRCVTCLKIEELTKEAIKSYKGMAFKLVNIDDAKNAKIAEKFEAAGTAVFIYNSKTGKKKDMTDFAFMNAGNKTKFIAGMKKEISSF